MAALVIMPIPIAATASMMSIATTMTTPWEFLRVFNKDFIGTLPTLEIKTCS